MLQAGLLFAFCLSKEGLGEPFQADIDCVGVETQLVLCISYIGGEDLITVAFQKKHHEGAISFKTN